MSFPRTSLLGFAYSFVRHPLLRVGVWGAMAVAVGFIVALVATLRGWRLAKGAGREPLNPALPSSAIMPPLSPGLAPGAGMCTGRNS